MRARAIVMPLPPRGGRARCSARRVETVLAERPCRVIIQSEPAATDDRGDAPAAPACRRRGARDPGARCLHRATSPAATPVLSARCSLLGVALIVARRGRGGGALASGSSLGVLFVPPARRPSRRPRVAERRARPMLAPRARLAGAVRDHLHVGRQRDLLLARRRRRPRARADAGRLPRRRRCSSSCGDDLRRGRLAAPGPRRLDGLRPLRFNELWSFIAGWAMLLDYMILLAVTAFTATNYLAAFWAPLGHGAPELSCRARRSSPTSRCATSAASRATRVQRIAALVVADIALQVAARSSLGLVAVLRARTRSPTRSTSARRRRGAT